MVGSTASPPRRIPTFSKASGISQATTIVCWHPTGLRRALDLHGITLIGAR